MLILAEIFSDGKYTNNNPNSKKGIYKTILESLISWIMLLTEK
jgi:hypothetical protein